jgi:sec-independent protein translocase protein TatA
LIILLVIILLLFGAKRIPELARGLGSGVREFRKGTKGEIDDEEKRGEVDEEKRGEELTAGADKDSARTQEEAARAEQAERSQQKH